MKISRSARSQTRAPRSIEALEDRIAPAATATLAGGLLTILGTAGSDSVTISETDTQGKYHVTGLAADTDFTGVTAIKVDLLGGTDTLLITDSVDAAGIALAKTLTVLSAGTLDLDIDSGVRIAGLASIQHSGSGDMTADIKGSDTILAELKIKDGVGNSTIKLDDHARIFKGITYDGGGNGDDNLTLEDSFVGGSVTFTSQGSGNTLLTLSNGAVGGSVKYTMTGQSADFSMLSSALVNGSVDLKLATTSSTSVNLTGSTIYGSLTVTTGNSADTILLETTDVRGKAVFKTGGNNDSVESTTSILGKGLEVTGGAGNLTVKVNTNSNIYGAVKISAPTALSLTTSVASSFLTGGVTVTSGAGSDSLTLDT